MTWRQIAWPSPVQAECQVVQSLTARARVRDSPYRLVRHSPPNANGALRRSVARALQPTGLAASAARVEMAPPLHSGAA